MMIQNDRYVNTGQDRPEAIRRTCSSDAQELLAKAKEAQEVLSSVITRLLGSGPVQAAEEGYLKANSLSDDLREAIKIVECINNQVSMIKEAIG